MAQENNYPIIGLENEDDVVYKEMKKTMELVSDKDLEKQVKEMVRNLNLLESPVLDQYMKLNLKSDLAYYQQNLKNFEKYFIKANDFARDHMFELALESHNIDAENDIVLKNRNLFWIKKIPGLINDKSSFIAVGALHLIGEYGFINLLRKQGYTVKPI